MEFHCLLPRPLQWLCLPWSHPPHHIITLIPWQVPSAAAPLRTSSLFYRNHPFLSLKVAGCLAIITPSLYQAQLCNIIWIHERETEIITKQPAIGCRVYVKCDVYIDLHTSTRKYILRYVRHSEGNHKHSLNIYVNVCLLFTHMHLWVRVYVHTQACSRVDMCSHTCLMSILTKNTTHARTRAHTVSDVTNTCHMIAVDFSWET